MNLLGYEGVPEVFPFDTSVKLWSNLAKQQVFETVLFCSYHATIAQRCHLPQAGCILGPQSSGLPSPTSWCNSGHTNHVQRAVPLLRLLLVFWHQSGWRNSHCLMEQMRASAVWEAEEQGPGCQRAGLGWTRKERGTSESAPMSIYILWWKSEASSRYCSLSLPLLLANTCEAHWHPYMSLFCRAPVSQRDRSLLLPGTSLASGTECRDTASLIWC